MLRPPRFDAPVDLEAHIKALPKGATTKGLFAQDYVSQVRKHRPEVDLFEMAGLPVAKYIAFKDYSYADVMRLQFAAAQALHPDVPVGEALRRVGQASYDAFLDNHIGRVVFGALGKNFGLVARVGVKGWQLSLNFGTVSVDTVESGFARYRFREAPIFLETSQVGVIEGAMRACNVSGDFLVDIQDISSGVIEARW